jgi:2-polyprenyl-6-methoxyphenol hydroxylase-like FAD-dependent oxidoreductase
MVQQVSGESSVAAVRSVLIVGAGIAGLSAATALARSGVEVTVLERDEAATGASIIFQYRPMYALEELGIADQVVAAGSALTAESVTPAFDANGQRKQVPAVALTPEWHLPAAVSIYRPALSMIMREAASQCGAGIRFGETYRSLTMEEDMVRAELASGDQVSCDLVIAADGIHSELRRQYFPEAGPPHYTGSMSLRVIIEDAPEHWHGGLHVADGGVVRTTMLPGRLFYVALGAHMERRRIAQDEARQIMRRVLTAYSQSPLLAEVRERLTKDVRVIVAPFEWIFVAPAWHRGRILLVGDAAHATAPTIGSAGGMALEDGVVLAQELARTRDVESALCSYTARRFNRTRHVVEASVELLKGEQDRQSDDRWAALRAGALQELVAPY